jgi:hypothetical protein
MPEDRPYEERPAARPIDPAQSAQQEPASTEGLDDEAKYQAIKSQLNLSKPATPPSDTTTTPAPVAPASGAPLPKKGPSGCLLVFLVIFGLIVAGIIIIIVLAASNSGGNSAQLTQVTAQTSCENMVRDQLKSPSSASFSNESEVGDSPVTVTGVVDSQNSFGATLRSSFHCTGTPDGHGGINTTLDSLTQQ